MPRFTRIEIGERGFQGEDGGRAFSASFPLFLVNEAWTRGCDFEDLADGYGAGLGTFGDWSGIRDSSGAAKIDMLERALNFLFGATSEVVGMRP